MTPYNEGAQAKRNGAAIDLPPCYVARFTKLGTAVPSAEGEQWLAGYTSVPRVASKAEVEAATRLTDVGQFRSRHRWTR